VTVRGYTSRPLVETDLNITLTAAQQAACELLLEPAEAWIEQHTGYVWADTAAVVDEQYALEGPVLYLARRPVASVQAVRVRAHSIGATDTLLAAGAGGGYELADAQRGVLLVNSAYVGDLVKVSYTPLVPVHPLVRAAATRLVGFWLRPALDGVGGDVQEYSVGAELSVVFKQGGRALGVPDEVVAMLAGLRALVFA
jgi:hypothetical protein